MKLRSQLALRELTDLTQPTDFQNVRLVQSACSPMAFIPFASFLDCIVKIFTLCANPKVIGIDAKPIIQFRAVVTDLLSFRNWSVFNNPRCFMGKHSWFSTFSSLYFSISISSNRTSPQPTSMWRGCFINFRPKSIAERSGKTLRKCAVLLKWSRHIKSSFFGLLARARLQPLRALSYFPFSNNFVNAF